MGTKGWGPTEVRSESGRGLRRELEGWRRRRWAMGWGGTGHRVPSHQVRPSVARSAGPLRTARASLPPAYLYLPARRSGPSRAAAADVASAAPRRILRPPPPCPEITLPPPPPYKEQNGKEKGCVKKNRKKQMVKTACCARGSAGVQLQRRR